jgi:hypothetical protein
MRQRSAKCPKVLSPPAAPGGSKSANSRAGKQLGVARASANGAPQSPGVPQLRPSRPLPGTGSGPLARRLEVVHAAAGAGAGAGRLLLLGLVYDDRLGSEEQPDYRRGIL